MQQSQFVSDGKTTASTNPDSGTTTATVLAFTLAQEGQGKGWFAPPCQSTTLSQRPPLRTAPSSRDVSPGLFSDIPTAPAAIPAPALSS